MYMGSILQISSGSSDLDELRRLRPWVNRRSQCQPWQRTSYGKLWRTPCLDFLLFPCFISYGGHHDLTCISQSHLGLGLTIVTDLVNPIDIWDFESNKNVVQDLAKKSYIGLWAIAKGAWLNSHSRTGLSFTQEAADGWRAGLGRHDPQRCACE
jgi:hypothetical protein